MDLAERRLYWKKWKKIPKESSIYMKIFKGREIGSGHSEVLILMGTQKLENRNKIF